MVILKVRDSSLRSKVAVGDVIRGMNGVPFINKAHAFRMLCFDDDDSDNEVVLHIRRHREPTCSWWMSCIPDARGACGWGL